jgi:PKD repeat protein
MKWGLIFLYLFVSSVLHVSGQCPRFLFTLSDSVCQNTPITITGNSSNIPDFAHWDFCPNDLGTQINPTFNLGNPGSLLNLVFGFSIGKTSTGQWYGFVSGLSGNLVRLNFGNSITNRPTATVVPVLGIPSFAVRGIKLIQADNGEWHLFAADFNFNRIIRVNFGTQLDNPTPVGQILGPIPGGILNNPSEIKVFKYAEEWYAVVSNYSSNNVVLLGLGSAPNGNVSFIRSLPGNSQMAFPHGTDVAFDCNTGWSVFVVANGAGKLFRADLKFDLQSPSIASTVYVDLGNPGGYFSGALGARVFSLSNKWYIWSGSTINTRLLEIGNLLTNPTLKPLYASNLGVAGAKFDIEVVRHDSGISVFTIPYNAGCNIGRVDYLDTCNVSVPVSNEWTPSQPIVYSKAGTYYIELTVDSAGFTQQIVDSVVVKPEPETKIGEVAGCLNQVTTLVDSTVPPPGTTVISRLWRFPDGTTSTDASTNYVFSAVRTDTVELTLVLSNGCSKTARRAIRVLPPPNAAFTFTGGSCAGDPIRFQDLSTTANGKIIQRKWDFGNGEISYQANPLYRYKLGGQPYDVTLIVTTDLGCTDTVVNRIYPPGADFNFRNGCTGDYTFFSYNSSYRNDTVRDTQWIFYDPGAGADSFSYERNPVHIFRNPGTFKVQLVVFTGNGCADTIIKEVLIAERPTAKMAVSQSGCVGEAVQFSDSSGFGNDPIVKWFWQLGPGLADTAAIPNPRYTYTAPGEYNIRLKVTTAVGCTSEVTRVIRIGSFPEAAFQIPETLCAGQPYVPQDRSSGTIANYRWDLGVGNIFSVLPTPNIIYSDTGSYVLGLTVQTAEGCSDDTSRRIVVIPSPKAGFRADPARGRAPHYVIISDTGLFGTSSFDIPGTIRDTTYGDNVWRYDSAGSYTITQVVRSVNGCTDTARKTVVVDPKIIPVYNLTLLRCEPVIENGYLIYQFLVRNNSNVPIYGFSARAFVNDGYPVLEDFNDSMAAGTERLFRYKARIGVNPYDSYYLICMQTSLPDSLNDINLADDSLCQHIGNQWQLIRYFPNPVQNELFIDVSLPEAGIVEADIIDQLGRKLAEGIRFDGIGGFNRFKFVFESNNVWSWGIYTFSLKYKDTIRRFRVIHYKN